MPDKRQQIIEVVPYNPNWPLTFLAEAKHIKKIFKRNLFAIYHIGSTAVPGMFAKPTIDILLEVYNIELVDLLNNKMAGLGYEAWGEYHISGRRFFVKGEDKRTYHVHVFQKKSSQAFRHLYFRDYLIAHPEEAKGYAQLKIRLAHKFRHNRRAYVQGKQTLVKDIEEKAIVWATQLFNKKK